MIHNSPSHVDALGKPGKVVDFEALERARTEVAIARLLRTQWGLDRSVSGKVYCDAFECAERIKSGDLPPVLKPVQFERISMGLAWGSDDDPNVSGTIEAIRSHEEPRPDVYREHPSYAEWQALPASIKSELRNDFRVYTYLKKHGQLAAVVDAIFERDAREASRGAETQRKRDFEAELEAAKQTDRYKEMVARLRNNKNYPGLMK